MVLDIGVPGSWIWLSTRLKISGLYLICPHLVGMTLADTSGENRQ